MVADDHRLDGSGKLRVGPRPDQPNFTESPVLTGREYNELCSDPDTPTRAVRVVGRQHKRYPSAPKERWQLIKRCLFYAIWVTCAIWGRFRECWGSNGDLLIERNANEPTGNQGIYRTSILILKFSLS